MKFYTASEVVEQLGNMDFDFDDGEDSDFEGEGVHSLLPRASLDSVEDGDHDEDDNGDEEDTHSDGDDGELDPPRPLVRVMVIRTLPQVSPTLVQARYKVW